MKDKRIETYSELHIFKLVLHIMDKLTCVFTLEDNMQPRKRFIQICSKSDRSSLLFDRPPQLALAVPESPASRPVSDEPLRLFPIDCA